MKRITTLLLVALAIVACLAGLYVSSANRDVVVLDLLFWPAVSLRSGVLVVLAFVAGTLTGMTVAGVAASARWRRQQWLPAGKGRSER